MQFHGSSYFFSWNWTTITMNKKIKRYITMSTAYDPIDKLLSHLWADSDNTVSISAPCWLKHCSQRSLSTAMLTYPLKSNRKHFSIKKITQKQYIGCKSTLQFGKKMWNRYSQRSRNIDRKLNMVGRSTSLIFTIQPASRRTGATVMFLEVSTPP